MKRTHYLTLCTDDGEVIDTYDIGGDDGWNLDKSLAKSVLMMEIANEVEADTEAKEQGNEYKSK